MNRWTKGVLAVSVATLALAAPATTATNRGAGPQTPIAVAFYEQGGTAIWDGSSAKLKQVRFLKGAQLAAISPSGASVAFVRSSGKGWDLFHTGVYAGYQVKLAHVADSVATSTSLAFSPDSRTIAFASPRGIELTSIVAGRSPRVLALPARWRGSSYQALQFSPDGKSLAFSRTWGNGKAGTLRNELAIARVAGGGARSLVANPEPYSAQYRPSFSPDGARIAFAAADGSIYVVPSAGGTAVRLTPKRTTGSDSNPLFSPDGATVAFTHKGSGPTDIWLVGSDGTALRRLTTTKPFPTGQPRIGSSALTWSPDGVDILAFRHDRFACVAADGSGENTAARTGVQYEISSAVWHG